MFRLHHDEDALDAALVTSLRRAGFDCLTAAEAGLRGRPDPEQLAFAADSHRVLYTKNTADFCRLDAEWRLAGRSHSGIIVCTDQRTPVGIQLRALQRIAETLIEEEMIGRLEFLLNHL